MTFNASWGRAMRVGVLGTGRVGRAIAARLAELGHEVVVGTRDPTATMTRTEPDGMGNPPFRTWAEAHPQVRVGSFADAAAASEVIVNATSGAGSLPSLTAAGDDNLAGKVLLDIANPLDFSAGMPPTLLVKDTDSLGEQIQRAFPQAKVVKTLNTMNALVMVHPDRVPGDHAVFVAGDDANAKQTVMDLLHGFGWSADNIVDSAASGRRAAWRCTCRCGCHCGRRSAPAISTSTSSEPEAQGSSPSCRRRLSVSSRPQAPMMRPFAMRKM
jgi:predicted dinucleotide-binding enzyme